MLSRVVPLRRRMHEEWVAGGRRGAPVYPLKLVIMSATLRTQDFTGNKRCARVCVSVCARTRALLPAAPGVWAADSVERPHASCRRV